MKSATRTTDKVVKRCPYCGARGPKQLVEGPRRYNPATLAVLILLAPCTCLLTLILLPFCTERHLEAYCDACGETFSSL